MKKIPFILLTILFASFTTTTPVVLANSAQPQPHPLPHPELWWKGSIQDAVKAGESQKRPLFIYWGAQWCPPCNELKAEVFSKPEFVEAVKPFILVGIDGDMEDAQKWGDHFDAAGYPTILVVNPDQKVQLKIVGAITLSDFQDRIKGLTQSAETSQSVLFSFLQNKPLSQDEWKQLGWIDWDHLKPNDTQGQEIIDIALKAFDQMPINLDFERARLANYILSSAQDTKGTSAASIKSKWDTMFTLITNTPKNRLQSESLITEGVSLIKWRAEGDANPNLTFDLISKWSGALAQLEIDSGDNLTNLTKITAARCELWKLNPTDPAARKNLRSRLDELLSLVMKSNDTYLLKSLLPSIADAMDALGEKTMAIDLLRNQADRVDTPWYFYSHIAYLMAEGGDKNGAVTWAEKAAKVVQGRASRLQVMVSYMNKVKDSTLPDKDARTTKALHQFYTLALTSSDSFYNRSLKSMNKASDIAKPLAATRAHFKRDLTKLSKRCATLTPSTVSKSCQDYFANVLGMNAVKR